MLESLIDLPYDVDVLAWALVGAIVALLGAARVHSSDRWWCPELAWFWHPLRKYGAPLLDGLLERVPKAFAKSQVYENEIVATDLDMTMEELQADLADSGYEVQPLASLATFDPSSDHEIAGEIERGSFARYHGDRVGGDLLESLPEWATRKRQVHIRPFGEDGSLAVTAHDEYSAWAFPVALYHLLAKDFDPETGVEMAAEDLDLDLDLEANTTD